jgi:hypothetical protein
MNHEVLLCTSYPQPHCYPALFQDEMLKNHHSPETVPKDDCVNLKFDVDTARLKGLC